MNLTEDETSTENGDKMNLTEDETSTENGD